MKKRWMMALMAAGCLFLMAGCQKETNEVSPTGLPAETKAPAEETVQQTEREVTAAWSSYLTEEDMQTASPWQACDNTALAAVMKRAEAGEPVTIAVIGGSITQGTISKGTNDSQVQKKACYADIFFAWWKETFPKAEITVVNAGIGATDSYLGVHRVEEDVLSYHPDVVLVEFSVNDEDTTAYKTSYDNLVYKLASSEDAPAVMLLFMGQTNLASAQNAHQLIGFNYKLPMVSYLNLLSVFLESGRYTDKELSGDVTHPSALGHAIVGEMLWNYLNMVYAKLDTYGEPEAFTKQLVTKDKYLDAYLAGADDITPDGFGSFAETGTDFNNWGNVWKTTEGTGELTFTVTCRNLGMLFWRSTSSDFGTYEVWVDGECVATLSGEFPGGWGSYAHSQEVFTSKEAAQHTVTIKKAEGSAGDDFVLLRLMIAR